MKIKINTVDYYFGFFGISAIVTKCDGTKQYFTIAFNGVIDEDREKYIDLFKKEVKNYASNKEFEKYMVIHFRGNTSL